MKFTSSVSAGTVKFKTSKTRKIWLRNFSGERWTGSVTFTWDSRD